MGEQRETAGDEESAQQDRARNSPEEDAWLAD